LFNFNQSKCIFLACSSSFATSRLAGKVVGAYASLAEPVKAFREVGMIAFVEFAIATAASMCQNTIHGNQTV